MKQRKLKKIDALKPGQREELACWVKTETFIDTRKLAHEKFGVLISISTLQRFHERIGNDELNESRAELTQYTKDLIHHAATGEASFHQATVQVIEQKALGLALTGRDHDKFKEFFHMKLEHEKVEARKKHIDIQQARLYLAQFKAGVCPKTPTAANASIPSPGGEGQGEGVLNHSEWTDPENPQSENSDGWQPIPQRPYHQNYVTESEQLWERQGLDEPQRNLRRGRYALTCLGMDDQLAWYLVLDIHRRHEEEANTEPMYPSIFQPYGPDYDYDANKKPWVMIEPPPTGSTLDAALIELLKAELQNPNGRSLFGPDSRTTVPLSRSEIEALAQNPNLNLTPHVVEPSGIDLAHRSADFSPLQTTPTPEQLVQLTSPLPGGKGQGEGERSSLNPDHSITDYSSLVLATRTTEYTARRVEEYTAHRRSISGWMDTRRDPPEYISQLRECPCGSALPCPHHEPFPEYFWKLSPFSVEYREVLESRNLPYREPREFCA